MDLHAAPPHLLSSRSHVPGPTQWVCLFLRTEGPPKGNKAVPDGDSIFPHPTPLCPTLSLPLRETPKPVKAG